MKLSTIQKIGGISLISGSVLLAAYSVCFSTLLPLDTLRSEFASVVLNSHWIWIAFVAFVGVILMIFGFTAAYSRIYQESKIIGLIGYIFIILAYLFQVSKVTWEIFLYPIIAQNQYSNMLLSDGVIFQDPKVTLFRAIASLTILIGIAFFCKALIASKVFPKIGGILIFAGALLYGFGPLMNVVVAISGIFIFSIGCSIIGLRLLKEY